MTKRYAVHKQGIRKERIIMKAGKRLAVLFLALTLTAVMLLPGCGKKGGTDYGNIQQDVIKGSNVFVTGGDTPVVFFGYGNYLCSALYESGTVYDFVIEASFAGEVYALAVYDGYIYVSASDGIFRYDMDVFEQGGSSAPEVVWDKNVSRYNIFEIYDGKLFLNYGTDLCYIPVEGGEATNLAMEVGDFEVTSKGIYYSKKDGSLHLISPDFSDDTTVGQVAAAAYLTMGNGVIYFRDGYDLKSIDLESGEVSAIGTMQPLGNYCYPWVSSSGTVLYQDLDARLHLLNGDDDSTYELLVNYPFKYSGCVFDDHVVCQSVDYDELSVIDLGTGAVESYDLGNELEYYLSLADGQGQTDTGQTGQTGGYDIMEGWEVVQDGSAMYLYGNDFLLIMPNTDDWEYRQESGDSFAIYMTEPRTEGYGGHLVTIKAYDLDDDSYLSLPSYSVAGVGKNVNKRFVAIFPTDVQFDSSNSAQSARYHELLDYVQKIGEGAVNSPFQTSDSD